MICTCAARAVRSERWEGGRDGGAGAHRKRDARDEAARQHQVPARFVLPLPLTEPSVYTAFNEFSRGVWVLALYPDTTCFYKALVHTAPSSMMGSPPPRDYLVEFEDESEASGKSEPMRVPQKYVLRLQN